MKCLYMFVFLCVLPSSSYLKKKLSLVIEVKDAGMQGCKDVCECIWRGIKERGVKEIEIVFTKQRHQR